MNADVSKAFGLGFLDVLDNGLSGIAADMVVAGDGVADLAAEEFVDGHACALAFDVPEGHVHAAKYVVVDGTVAPVGTEVAALPEILDLLGIFADQPGSEVLFNGGNDGVGR